jgi:hypothetical protein
MPAVRAGESSRVPLNLPVDPFAGIFVLSLSGNGTTIWWRAHATQQSTAGFL